MALESKTISRGFIIAGVMNMSVLIFSRLFTNTTISEFDPQVMSTFGLLMIIIWGLAYISVARNYQHVKWLIGVFVIEKFLYGYTWTNWMLNNSLSEVYDKDVMAGLFYTLYGINDWIFFLFFLYVFIKIIRKNHEI